MILMHLANFICTKMRNTYFHLQITVETSGLKIHPNILVVLLDGIRSVPNSPYLIKFGFSKSAIIHFRYSRACHSAPSRNHQQLFHSIMYTCFPSCENETSVACVCVHDSARSTAFRISKCRYNFLNRKLNFGA